MRDGAEQQALGAQPPRATNLQVSLCLNDEFWITNDESCTKTDEFWITNDDFGF